MALGRGGRIWLGLLLATVVVWLIADSQDTALLALKAHGASLTLLQILWVVSLFGFILLVLFGLVVLIRSRLRSTA